jgi:hypothetical protein
MDVKTLVDNRITELQPIYDRMDSTRDLIYMKKYTLMDFDGKTPLTDVVNETLNTPAVFANSMISDLMGSVFQWQIEGDKKLSVAKQRLIRSFIMDLLAQIDEQLVQGQGMPGLQSWLSSHVVARSLIGARLISQVVNGEYTVDCLPTDMRYCPFQFGKKGLDWACNITYRTYAAVKDEYPDYQGTENETDIEVRDFWSTKENEVSVGEQTVVKQTHKFGRVPFIIVLPASGFMLRDKDYLAHESEDPLFLDKNLFDEDNRLASIAATKGMETVRPAYQQKVKDVDSTPAEAPPGLGETKKVPIEGGWDPLKRPDINQAFLTATDTIKTALRQGGLNDIDLGNVDPQNMSAILLSKQNEIRSKFRKPRLEAIEIFYQQFARMAIEQYNKCLENTNGKEIMIGQTGRKKVYGNLGDPSTYIINAKLMSHDKTMEIANASVASALWEKLPDEWIIENILQAEDTDEIMRKLAVQKAKRADPFIEYFELAIRYAEEAEEMTDVDADIKKIESMKLTDICVSILQQRNMPQQPAPGNQAKPQTNALAAMAARSGILPGGV